MSGSLSKYDDCSKQELIQEIQKLKQQKKYGLVWDETNDKINEIFKNKKNTIPILKEITSKAIKNSSNINHILIEGDNYHALSALNYTHKKKIDLIYIDPPYNTGKEFIYNDKLVDSADGYKHSKWLNFMSKRLTLSKKLLTNGGCIFISIDDHEVAQLKLLCDNIFGEINFLSQIVWHSKYTRSNDKKFVSRQHEYLLVYSNNIDKAKFNLLPRTEKTDSSYKNPDNDPRGKWKPTPLHAKSGKTNIKYTFTKVRKYNGDIAPALTWSAPQGRYPRYNKERLKELEEDGRITCGKNGTGVPNAKTFLNEVKPGITTSSLWNYEDVGHTHQANEELSSILGKGAFDNPKPVNLIKQILYISSKPNSIILDFFAGSGTTAHAVLEINKNDHGKRQVILCTNNEGDICKDVCYPRVKKIIEGYDDVKKKKILGFGGNLKYYKTSFIDCIPTDHNKKRLTDNSRELLCLKESCFEFVNGGKHFNVFTNGTKYLGIIYDEIGIRQFKKQIRPSEKYTTYIFSLDDSAYEEEFEEFPNVTTKPIPQEILYVYRRIFK